MKTNSNSLRVAWLALGAGLLGSACSTLAGPAPAPTDRQPPDSVMTILLGRRTLDDDVAWDQLDEQTLFGFEYASRGPSGVGLDSALSYSSETTEDPGTGIDVTGSLLEIDIGGRYTFGGLPVYPYLQGGLGLVVASVEAESGGITASDEDFSAGLYLGGGVYAVLGTSFLVGVSVRALTGTSVEIVGIDTDADHREAALFIGRGL
jgi:hypothetical protein